MGLSTFAAVAEPTRRRILDLLCASEQSVGNLVEQLSLSQPSVSKHLKVLREARLVQARVSAQRRLYRLNPAPLLELDAWLEPYRRFWSSRLDALGQHLDEHARARSRAAKSKGPRERAARARRDGSKTAPEHGLGSSVASKRSTS